LFFLHLIFLIFLQRIFHVHKIMSLSCVRDGKWEKKMREKKKKCVDHVREKGETK
jgi:hypothetical protein